MCGIFGGTSQLLRSDVMERLTHRGPDQQGTRTFSLPGDRDILMGQTRLSIVDRRDVDVPLKVANAHISFNGEIYNWREIRRQLENTGITFCTDTDTEVVLRAYLRWGPQCLKMFNGMFAFAIWDGTKLFLARDRVGKKPLFYMQQKDKFAFCSELKGFKNLIYNPIPLYEITEFYFDDILPFRDVMSLKPGEYLIHDFHTGVSHRETWWAFPEYDGSITSTRVAIDEFVTLFTDACRLRRMADAPVTMLLSGGIDSTLIELVSELDTTFTCQFREYEDTINEQDLVLESASILGFDARVIKPDRDDFLRSFSKLAWNIELPVGSLSVFPLYCLARAVHESGFKVVLSGEGADELFNGYYRNELLLGEDLRLKTHIDKQYSSLAERYYGPEWLRVARMMSRDSYLPSEGLIDLIRKRWKSGAPLAYNISLVEATIFLQPLLAMADRMSMAHSLEVRNPFLDYRIIEFSAKLDPNLKFRGGRGKWIVREALRELSGGKLLGVLERPVKHGLPAPVSLWLTGVRSLDRKKWNEILMQECMRQLDVQISDTITEQVRIWAYP